MRRPKVKLDNLIAIMTVAAKRNIDEAYFTQTHNADLAIATVASWRGVLVWRNRKGDRIQVSCN
jgi:hypothetical protein